MTPYLKGLHLTIDVWRPGRDSELRPEYSQKPKDRQREVRVSKWNSESWMEEGETDKEDVQEECPPELVNPAPRLTLDVEALEKLTASKEPAATKYRVGATMSALYLMGDASGQGFGSGLWDGKGLWYEAANWADHHRDGSSNWKEANNLTLKVEELAKEGKLNDA